MVSVLHFLIQVVDRITVHQYCEFTGVYAEFVCQDLSVGCPLFGSSVFFFRGRGSLGCVADLLNQGHGILLVLLVCTGIRAENGIIPIPNHMLITVLGALFETPCADLGVKEGNV